MQARRIVAIGGAVNNAFWMQNKADVLGTPVEVPDLDEAVPLGAAVLAGIGVGLYRDEAGRAGEGLETRPHLRAQPAARGAYAAWFSQFERLYPALCSWHAAGRAC